MINDIFWINSKEILFLPQYYPAKSKIHHFQFGSHPLLKDAVCGQNVWDSNTVCIVLSQSPPEFCVNSQSGLMNVLWNKHILKCKYMFCPQKVRESTARQVVVWH